MRQNKMLTTAHTPRTQKLVASSYEGMAHWAGTDPGQHKCCTCSSFVKNTEKVRRGHCSKFKAMMPVVRKTLTFPGSALACMYYVRRPGLDEEQAEAWREVQRRRAAEAS